MEFAQEEGERQSHDKMLVKTIRCDESRQGQTSKLSALPEALRFSVFYFQLVKVFYKHFNNWQKEVKMAKVKGQSVLEYVLILTAVIAAIIVVSQNVGKRVQNSVDSVTNEMENAANKIKFTQ